MLSKLKQLFKGDDWSARALEWLSVVENQPSVQLMPRLTEWLGNALPTLMAQRNPLETLLIVLQPLKAQLDRALLDVFDGPPNPIRLSLQVRGAAAFATMVRGQIEHLLEKQRSVELAACWLEWYAAERVVLRLRDGAVQEPEWNGLFARVQFYLDDHSAKHHLLPALFQLVLSARAVSADLHTRQPLLAFRIAVVLANTLDPFIDPSVNSPGVLGGSNEEGGSWPVQFGTGRTLDQLNEYEYLMAEQWRVPAVLFAENLVSVHEVLTVVRAVKRNLLGKRVSRVAQRHQVQLSIHCATRFENIRGQISNAVAPTVTAKPLEFEACDVVDISMGGLGLAVPADSDWILPNMLVALKTEDDKRWRLAVVRRVAARGMRQLQIGVQILARQPDAVRALVPSRGGSWENLQGLDGWEGTNAIYISSEKSNDFNHFLIASVNELKPGVRYGVPGTCLGDLMLQVIEIYEVFADAVMYRCERVAGEEVLHALNLNGTSGWLLQ